MKIDIIVESEGIKRKLNFGHKVKVTADGNRRVIFYTEPDIATDEMLIGLGGIAFNNSDIISMNRKDAENILDMLNEAIDRLGRRTENDDNDVFGDRAISYERLIDALEGLIYSSHDTPN